MGVEDDTVVAGLKVTQRGHQVGTVCPWATQQVRRHDTKPLPLQLFTHGLALTRLELRQQHQRPSPVPGWLAWAIDALEGFFETPTASACQAVITASAHLFCSEPTFFGQAKDRRAYQPFIDADRLQQVDQATEPDCTAVRLDGIAVQRDDQGTGADRRLFLKASDQVVQWGKIAHGRTVRG
ncbi:hypothetical protein D3C75_821500 [compost metagenome]